jgi:soluble lytic murein transglycosylase-like protein
LTPTIRTLRSLVASAAIVAAAFAAGCSSSRSLDSLSADIIAPVSESVAESFDVALPQTVSAVPYSSRSGEPAGVAADQPAAGVQLASLKADRPALSSAFAGPSPSSLRAAAPIVNRRHDAAHVDRLIAKYAAHYDVPESLVRKVVERESTFNPAAYSKGHWGLMQIKHATARGMGYDGPAEGLLDPETNLKYAVKYLRGAYLVAGGDARRADRLYQRGYYYDAKRAGLLDETGLGRDRSRKRATGA